MSAPVTLDTPLARVLAKLPGHKKQGDRWLARCPAHKDTTPSLAVKQGADGRVLMHCFAKCHKTDIVKAMGLEITDLFPPRQTTTAFSPPLKHDRPVLVKTYDYTDEHGQLLYQVCRYEPGEHGKKKDFRQRRPDGKGGWIDSLGDVPRVLYRLPDVIEAASMGRPIYVVEGEKDADALAEMGYTATTNMGGANGWREEYAKPLAGAQVYILPDNDEPGRARAEQIAASLTSLDCAVKVISLPDLPEKGDVSDWLEGGHDLDELEEIVSRAPMWYPDPSRRTWWWLEDIYQDEAAMRPPPPIIPYVAWEGRSTLFAAWEKLGKSTLLGFLAAQVIRGGEFLGEPVEQGRVLTIGLEEPRGDVARRMKKFGIEDPRRCLAVCDRLIATDLEGRIAEIRSLIDAVKPLVVFVDTLIAFGDASVSDWTSSAQAAPVVNALTRLAHDTNTAIVLVHHAKKSDGKYRDSSAIGGAVDVIAEMTAPDVDQDPTLRKLGVRGRLGMYSARFRYDGDTYLVDRGDAAPLEYRIREFVRAKVKCSVRDVVDGVKGRAETISTCIAQMIADGRLIDLTPDRKHKTLMAPATKQEEMTWES